MENKIISTNSTTGATLTFAREVSWAFSSSANVINNTTYVSWSAPAAGSVKLNTDGSVQNLGAKCGFGGILGPAVLGGFYGRLTSCSFLEHYMLFWWALSWPDRKVGGTSLLKLTL